MFNPYVQKPEWPAGIVQDHDVNDVPAECKLYSRLSLDDVPFNDRYYDERSAMQRLTEYGHIRALRVA